MPKANTAGIDFIVDPTPLTTKDRKMISEIIAYYKATGRKMPLQKSKSRVHKTDSSKTLA